MMTQNQTQQYFRAVLEAIDRLEKLHPGRYAEDKDIASETKFDIQDVRDYIDILEDEGKVRTAHSFDGHAAILEARGRLVLKDPQYGLSNSPPIGGITINGDVNTDGGAFTGRDSLHGLSPSEPSLSDEEKELLIAAYKNEGQIALFRTQRIDFIRIGGHNYVNDEIPSSAIPYCEALEDLVERGCVRHESGSIYKLTSLGRRRAKGMG